MPVALIYKISALSIYKNVNTGSVLSAKGRPIWVSCSSRGFGLEQVWGRSAQWGAHAAKCVSHDPAGRKDIPNVGDWEGL